MPTVVDGVKPSARLACEEIFGPVLAVLKVRNFEEGIRVANDSEYGLTGALYSRVRERLERGKRELFVGNLYLNRKCTGALVGVHPFGGFNMSGTDSKAGGREYLYLFTQQKAITEKLVGGNDVRTPDPVDPRHDPRHHRDRLDSEERSRQPARRSSGSWSSFSFRCWG